MPENAAKNDPAAVSLRPVLAIDIGGTKIAGGLVTPDGEVHQARTVPTHAMEGGEVVMRRAIDLARELLAAGRETPDLLPAAIGVGTGGLVKLPEGSIASATSAIPGWTGMAVRARLSEALSLPAVVENDGNAMALGEALFGSGKGCSQVIGLTVGTGIGGGIVIDGRIFHGAHGFSSHLGHIILKIDGRLCPCGRRGCLEAYASGPAMAADFADRVGEDHLLADFGLQPGQFGFKEVAELASQGVPPAVAVLEQGAAYLGAGIGSLIALLDPDIVVVGGGVAQSGERYFTRLQAAAAERRLPGGARVPVVPAALKTWANLVGAACLVWGSGERF